MIQLRDYQQEGLQVVEKEFSSEVFRQLIVLPCGTGKTILMAAIAKLYNKKTLILTHREELISQTTKKVRLFWPYASLGICKAQRNSIQKQIVIASVQTSSKPKRLHQLQGQDFEILLIDEAHHAAAATYKKIITALGFNQTNTKLLVGFTATPTRNDKNQLGDVFEKVVFMRSISTMIKAGYLCPVFGRKILTTTSLDHVASRMGDFISGQLSNAVNTPERNAFIVQKYQAYASSRKGIAFCVDVQHCKDLAAAFRAQGIKATAIWGAMPPKDRQRVLKNLKKGTIRIAVSCGVLTEGFDEPSIDVIVMARPTKSRGLYIQCVGRGLRLSMGKSDCLVLDFADSGHDLNSLMSLSKAIPEAPVVVEEKEKRIQEKSPEKISARVVELYDKEFDLLGQTRFLWVALGDDEYSLSDDEHNEIVVRPQGNSYSASLYSKGQAASIISEPLPLDYCQGVCEDFARMHLKIKYADTSGQWLQGANHMPPTQAQVTFLAKHDMSCKGMSRARTSFEIRKVIALQNKERRIHSNDPITLPQKEFLEHYGIPTEGLSKRDAMSLIRELKGNQAR